LPEKGAARMAISELSLEREDRDGVQIVHVRGPLDSLSHDQFKEYMDELAGQPHPNIVLDCEHLSYINSRGITLLARYQRALSSSLAFFGIAALNARLMKSIELLGMAKILRLYPTLDDAMKAATALASGA